MSTEVLKKEKIPWLLIIPFIIIVTALGTIWTCILPSNMTLFYNPGDVNCSQEFSAMPYLTMLISAGFFLLSKRKINVTTLTYIYAASIVCTYQLGYGAYDMPAGMPAGRWTNPTESGAWLQLFMAPPSDVASQILSGGIPVPWGAWLPAIIYWWALFAMMCVFMLSISTFWRRRWIDVEQVPFPTTIAIHQIIEHATGQKKSKRPYLIGTIIGLCLQFPIFLINIFPWFPDIYGWRSNTFCYGAGWLPSGSALYGIYGLAFLNKNPSLGALFYLAPLGTLLSSILFTIIFFILTQAAYMMGYYSGIPMNEPCGCPSREGFYNWQAPFQWAVVTNGAALGLVISYIVMNRRFLIDTLRDAFGAAKMEGQSDELPYRHIYLLMAGSFIITVALLMMIGISVINAMVMLIMTFITYFATMFIYARVGYNATGLGTSYGMYYLRAVWPVIPSDWRSSPDYVLSVVMMRQAGSDGFSKGWGGGLASTFQGYKMAGLTGTSSRNVFKVMFAATLLAPFVWWITFISLSYSVGLARLGVYLANTGVGRQVFDYADPSSGRFTYIGSFGGTDPSWIPNFVAGFIIIFALSFMHARFVWFPFDQYGFILAFCARGFFEGIWTMTVIAWILKMATLRLGGSKLYEEKGVPIATGILLGYALSILAGGLIGAIRFIVPF